MMSAVHAMEQVFGVTVDGPIRELRRLVYCGEWIESHGLHVYMLHAPDFLGYESAIHMAKDYPEVVQRGLRLKKVGNDVVTLIGGREIHPVNIRVGGFYRVPTKRELSTLADELRWACDAAEETVRWTASLPTPDFEQDYEFVALRHPAEYPFNEGRLVSNQGLDIDIGEFYEHVEETHVKHSTSLHSRLKSRGAYFVGPQARYSLNFDKLTPRAQEAARAAGLAPVCRNPFQSIVVRSVEILYACEEALRIIDAYEPPDRPAVDYQVRAGVGHGCTEAPRGICYHRYQVDGEGLILDARIAPPTAQNQMVIESDLSHYVESHLDLPNDQLQWQCEQAVRNYDPCISCSCHSIRVRIDRS
jgi:coenzyme F420-reducing hydrogenase alpha subunit